MTRTQIATPRCGTISKLVVSIGSGETFITYADASTRSYYANPSWLILQNGMVDLGPIREPITSDYPKKATAFLERHFGGNSQVRTSKATQQRLASMQLHVLADNSEMDCHDEDALIWHTWLVEKVKFPPTQCAVISEWNDPFTETLTSSYCSWHLKNCMAWQLIVSNKRAEANCFCLRIKKIMDIAHSLVDPELEQNESGMDRSSLVPALTSAADLLQKLNDLLELQEKRNRLYKCLAKI
ncbi:uncharacterized protein LOC128254402 isoform X2 [Drosophila gunungcola]|uniref:uncharacterized protein LOC128254402 isoform X2 n=1 Tax=Drosophila gunungcola TaxID=103775 RepID=UPI0022E81393|nr:uncharacterized protein LOC128254402 isoform X2 [Drosophila gunungcola]